MHEDVADVAFSQNTFRPSPSSPEKHTCIAACKRVRMRVRARVNACVCERKSVTKPACVCACLRVCVQKRACVRA